MRSAIAGLLVLALCCQDSSAQNYGASPRYGDGSSDLPPIGQSGLSPTGPAAADSDVGSAFGSGGIPTSRPSTPAASAPSGYSPPSQKYGIAPPPASSQGRSESYQPVELMSGMMRAPSGSRLSGSPVRLEQVVASGARRSQQTQRINAYWDLCSAVADYYLGLHEASELNMHQQRLGGRSPSLGQAISKWRTRITTSQLAAAAAQRRLADMMGVGALPLPGDLPLCGEYNTKFERAFTSGPPPEARELNQLIPLRFAELVEAAAEVTRSQDFLSEVKDRDQNGDAVLKALQLLALNRRAFVQIAKDYNRQITRYTELATPGDIATGRLVAMLVERPRTASSQSSPSAEMPPVRPQTFKGGLRQ